jgi:hypothetical protein
MFESIKETIKTTGENLVSKVEELIKEGNVRKISIHNKEGKEIMNFPLTLGVAGAVLAPVFAAVGALAAVLTECTIVVEKEDTAGEKKV